MIFLRHSKWQDLAKMLRNDSAKYRPGECPCIPSVGLPAEQMVNLLVILAEDVVECREGTQSGHDGESASPCLLIAEAKIHSNSFRGDGTRWAKAQEEPRSGYSRESVLV